MGYLSAESGAQRVPATHPGDIDEYGIKETGFRRNLREDLNLHPIAGQLPMVLFRQKLLGAFSRGRMAGSF